MEVGILVVAIAVVAFIAGFAVRGRDSGRRARPLREPGRSEHVPAPVGSTTADFIAQLKDRPAVEEFIRRGKKIDAIKEFRDQARCGLKEAKDAVEAMEREMGGPPS